MIIYYVRHGWAGYTSAICGMEKKRRENGRMHMEIRSSEIAVPLTES